MSRHYRDGACNNQMLSAQPEDYDRPNEVELLLDRQRPEMPQCTGREEPRGCHPHVVQVRPVPDRVAPEFPYHRIEAVRPRQYYEEQRKRHVIEREDAQEAPRIELTEVVLAAPSVVENSRDEISREHKEQIHTRPPDSRNPKIEPVKEDGRRLQPRRVRRKVEDQNE